MGNLIERCVLDLFAGSGAMGLEALSRGAQSALFVDQARESIELIKKNAASTGLLENSSVVQADAGQFIAKQNAAFDLIFMDPPYSNQDTTEILQLIAEKNLLKPRGVICVETADTTSLPETVKTLIQFDRRKYGSTSISFYQHGDLLQ
jgi:16S rRNA (guanine(966)-N(2))-methyltransferase RsmD